METRRIICADTSCRMVWPCSPAKVIRTLSNAPSCEPRVGTCGWGGGGGRGPGQTESQTLRLGRQQEARGAQWLKNELSFGVLKGQSQLVKGRPIHSNDCGKYSLWQLDHAQQRKSDTTLYFRHKFIF